MLPRYRPPLVLLALLATAAFALPQDATAQEKTVVVHIGQFSNDLHSPAMGLSLARNLAEAGASVTVFLDREGVRMADRGQPMLVYGDTDLEELLSAYMDAGGRVLICPHCAELGGVERGELRSGMEMGTQESVARLFMDADLVISY
jgi:sulfur relay (sulfurtransferase) complex TusBCD TusD component (DsrE family)